ncbi:MAG TPA: aminopeptidase N [Nocardioides sp.]|nr:aminopeptidase N [Nocardioides sp.]
MSSPHAPLQHSEALARRALLRDLEYDVALDLAGDERTFGSRTTIRFASGVGRTFVDVRPAELRSAVLDGRSLDLDAWERGRLPLDLQLGEHELVVDAVMAFRFDGEGLHRSVDPADGRHYVYGMSFLDAAPTVFACFDQPDLKAPYTLHVRAPESWTVVGNAPGEQVEPGVWELERSRPLATYGVTVVAGPYHQLHHEHDGIPLGLSARASLAADLEKDADELFTLTAQGLDELHRLFGIRYAFGHYHQAFVPDFNAGAMENPGCVTVRDTMLFTSRASRSQRVQRATTLEHELAHQWFGNLVTPAWWDDLWLNESFAEYLGNRVTAAATAYDDVLVDDAYARRQWGLIGDQGPSTHPIAGNGAADAAAALQDFDGISYAKGCAVLRQLSTSLGDEVFLGGVVDLLERHRFGNAALADLVACWERAGATDLGAFTTGWLRSAGPDRIELDRTAGVLRRTPPPGADTGRSHRLHAAVATATGWELRPVVVDRPEVPFEADARAVVLDPHLETWAVTPPDITSARELVDLLPTVEDPLQRAATWSGIRSALHNAVLPPDLVLELVLAAPPVEDLDDAEHRTMGWVREWVLPLQPDPERATARLHAVLLTRLDSAPPASEEQFAALRAAVATSSDPSLLRSWLSGAALPDGVQLDLDLRWRLLGRLAALGETDLTELDRARDHEPTAAAGVGHAHARASLPTPEAKAWAWSCFTGTTALPTLELEAAGRGLWQHAQRDLTAPYVDRYLADVAGTAQVRSGWTLGLAAGWFFPRPWFDEPTVEGLRHVLSAPGLDGSLRRTIADLLDLQERKLAARGGSSGPAPRTAP